MVFTNVTGLTVCGKLAPTHNANALNGFCLLS